jgi:hypothetical protein
MREKRPEAFGGIQLPAILPNFEQKPIEFRGDGSPVFTQRQNKQSRPDAGGRCCWKSKIAKFWTKEKLIEKSVLKEERRTNSYLGFFVVCLRLK